MYIVHINYKGIQMNTEDENKVFYEPIYHCEKFSIKLSGNEMEKSKGYNLAPILTTLNSFEKITKKTYLHNKGTTRFTQEDENNFSIRLHEVKEGSFLSTFTIAYSDVIIPMIPLIMDNKELIWSSLKTSYDFLKAKISAEKEGKTLQINQTTDLNGNNISVNHVNNSTVNINVYPGIPDLATKIAPDIAAVTKLVDQENVSQIRFSSEDKTSEDEFIQITSEDKELFSTKTYTEDYTFSLRGKIVDGDYTNLKGQIEVFETDSKLIEVGDIYKFKVNDNLNGEENWKQMFLENRPYYCKQRIEINPMREKSIKIIEIIIVDWDKKNWNN